MNKSRRARLNAVINSVYDLRTEVEAIKDEEEDAKENLLQSSIMYDIIEESVDNMNSAINSIDDVIVYLEGAMG